jgi:hypothetical protein
MKSKVYKEKVNTRNELVAHITNGAALLKQECQDVESQLFVVFCLQNIPQPPPPQENFFLLWGEGIYYTSDNFLFSIKVSDPSNHK